MYFYRFRAGNVVETKKLVVLKQPVRCDTRGRYSVTFLVNHGDGPSDAGCVYLDRLQRVNSYRRAECS